MDISLHHDNINRKLFLNNSPTHRHRNHSGHSGHVHYTFWEQSNLFNHGCTRAIIIISFLTVGNYKSGRKWVPQEEIRIFLDNYSK